MEVNNSPQLRQIAPKIEKENDSTIGATCVAVGAVPGTYFGIKKLSRPIGKMFLKEFEKLPTDVLEKAANEALNSSGLAQNGVKIFTFTPNKTSLKIKASELLKNIKTNLKPNSPGNINITPTSITDKLKGILSNLSSAKEVVTPDGIAKAGAVEALKTEFNKIFGKFAPKNYIDKLAEGSFTIFEQGKNAAFLRNANKIIAPKNLLGAAFHEMGHALNSNTSKFWRIMQKCQPLKLLALPFGLATAFMNKAEEKDGKPLTTGEKVKNTVRDNAGKLAFACWIPTLLEEAKATMRGNKLAKQVLSPEIAKQVAKGNKIAFCTYLALATASSVAAWAGVKIKDALTKKKNN